jgi:hypothetical protein
MIELMADVGRSREITCYSFLVVFANDNLIDEMELAFLEKIALHDGRVDDDERAVLSNIFARAERAELDVAVRTEIEQFKRKYEIP